MPQLSLKEEICAIGKKNILEMREEGILAPLDHFSQVDDKHLCIFTFFTRLITDYFSRECQVMAFNGVLRFLINSLGREAKERG